MFTHTNLLLALASLAVVAEAHVRPHARDVQQAAHVIPAAMHRAAALHAHYSHPRRISGVKPRGRAERLAKRSSGAQATVKCLSETTFALCDEYGKCTDMGAVAAGTACVNNAITWATHDEVPADAAAVTEEIEQSLASPSPSPSASSKVEAPKATPTLINSRPIIAAPVVNAAVKPDTTSVAAAASPTPEPAETSTSSGDDEDEDCEDEGDDTEEEWDCSTEEAEWLESQTQTQAPAQTWSETSSSSPAAVETPKVQAVSTTPAAAPTTTTWSAAAAPAATTTAASNSGSGASSEDFTGGKATFFYQGGAYGACGIIHQDSDYIVALQMDRYGSGSNNAPDCGRKVVITNVANGKTVTATVADACPGCANYNSLDLSVGAFDQIAEQSTGVIDIKWHFAS